MDHPEKSMRLNVPLNALRAFEAAARHLSVKDAAFELGVTPSAISHQIRILENILGVELLRRAGGGLELTESGEKLVPDLTDGFARIIHAVGNLQTGAVQGPLRLSMLPTFAAHWLSPRLVQYPFEKAGFELLISTSQQAVDLQAGVADSAIRHGQGQWPGLAADLLFNESVTLLGTPEMARGSTDDIRARISHANLFLSQHRRGNFATWNATLPGGPVTPAAITYVDSAGLGLRAAIDGAGMTLASSEIAASDIAAGRLAPLLPHKVASGAGYYLVYPDRLKRDRRLRNLRHWLLGIVDPVPAQTFAHTSPSQ
ncbi:LysR substrate-binding domain-containing protein [Thalassospira profundimaris]|uniref:LysR substrate-binding domain-containing protein n=1 Tax=Thalassospira profundimaris TaxID=502049 RepID=UPI000DEE07A3|nr:LysR substrate-binding domain-containing protein [Thalassospira profundimaris]